MRLRYLHPPHNRVGSREYGERGFVVFVGKFWKERCKGVECGGIVGGGDVGVFGISYCLQQPQDAAVVQAAAALQAADKGSYGHVCWAVLF